MGSKLAPGPYQGMEILPKAVCASPDPLEGPFVRFGGSFSDKFVDPAFESVLLNIHPAFQKVFQQKSCFSKLHK